MGWLGRGIGDFGSQVGQGYDINLGWKERLQNMAMEQARQKLADLMGPLQLQEIQQRLKQMQDTQPAGIEKGATGALSGIKWNPTTHQYEIQQLATGGGPTATKITTPFEAWRAENPNAPLADWFKLERAPAKPEEGVQGERVDNQGRLWDFNKGTNKWELAPVNAKFPVPKEGAEGGIKTPFELWLKTHPKGTYDQWARESKQEDRADATKAVSTALNAQKSLQALELNIQKMNKTFSIWNPKTWGTDPAVNALAQQALDDFKQKQQDAAEKLTDAGMPVPTWLSPGPPAPAGFTDKVK